MVSKNHRFNVRAKKNVTGKCWTCEDTNALRKRSLSREESLQLIRQRAEHRHAVKSMRIRFREYVQEARESIESGTYLKFALGTDGAESNKIQIPFKPEQPSNPEVLHHHLQLVMLAGIGNRWVITNPLVRKGGSLTATCLVDCFDQIHPNAEEVNVELDGGPENWNNTVMGLFALLCSLGPRTVTVRRALVGHTHGAYDQMFSKLRHYMYGVVASSKGRSIITPAEFISAIDAATPGSNNSFRSWFVRYDMEGWITPFMQKTAGWAPRSVRMFDSNDNVLPAQEIM